MMKNSVKRIVTGITAGLMVMSMPALAASAEPVNPNYVHPGLEENISNDTVVTKDYATGEIYNETVSPISMFSASAELPGYTPEMIDTYQIVGNDDRVQMASYKKIVFVEAKFPDGYNMRGTGVMVDTDIVLTNRHVVYDTKHGGWADLTYVIPGRTGSSYPYGRIQVKKTSVGSLTDDNKDYAVMRLSTAVGSKTGWFGVRKYSSSMVNSNVTISGYPGDKSGYTMWTMKGPITRENSTHYFYNIDTAGGQSGSPIYETGDMCVGIHQGTYGSGNRGIRMNDSFYQLIVDYKNGVK